MSTEEAVAKRCAQTGRSLLAKLLVALALLAIASITTPAGPALSAEPAAAQSASIWLDGPNQAAQGETIAYEIRTDAAGLYGLQFDISFDPAVLQGVSTELTPGSCPVPDFVQTNVIDNTSGTISYVATALNPSPPCDGGVVASLQFAVAPAAAAGNTQLQFANVILSDVDGTEIPSTAVDLTLQITEEIAVAANFSGTPTTGPAPLNVSFTNLSSGLYTACTWTFGDGSSSTSCLNQSHTYSSVGRFTVSLTVEAGGSSDNETKVDYIVVVEPPEQYDVYAPVVLGE